jgi:acetyl esterase/lipase
MSSGPFPDVPDVQWKDAVYDAARGLKVRLYKPSPPAAGDEGNNKLPVLVYFHGGGYCIGTYDHPMFHSFCQRFAAEIPAVVLSVQYRLAPEHRLPAAIDDAATFFSWLHAGAGSAEPWLAESADLSRTFVAGVSAGANLAHHVVVRIASGQIALVVAPARDVLFGHVLRYAARLKEMGKAVKLAEFTGDRMASLSWDSGARRRRS